MLHADDAAETIAPQGRGVVQLTRGTHDRLVEQSASAISDERGEPWGEIRALRDVNEATRSRDLLHQQAVELAERDEELEAFAHTVAHDIKDPLNVIRGTLRFCADDLELDEDQRVHSLETIVGYSKRLANIVDELLLLATVRDADVQHEPLAMPEIVAPAEERLAYSNLGRGHRSG